MADRTTAVVVLEGDGLRLAHSMGAVLGERGRLRTVVRASVPTAGPPEPADARLLAFRLDAAREPKCLLVRMERWKLPAAQMALKARSRSSSLR